MSKKYNIGLEIWLALRYLKEGGSRGFLSVSTWFSFIGISLGVATLIIVLSVMNGFRADLFDRILGVQGHFNVIARSLDAQKQFDDIAPVILKAGDGDIIQLSPVIDSQALIVSSHQADGVLIRAMHEQDIKARPLLKDALKGGESWDGFDQSGGIYLGYRLANRLNIQVGDAIKLMSPKFNNTGFGAVPRIKTYIVKGIFDVGMYQYDNMVAFLPIKDARLFLKLGADAYHMLEGTIKKPEEIAKLANKIAPLLDNSFYFQDWQSSNGSLVSALKVERNVMFIILTLIILVAAFNIISGQVMMVNNKRRAIALLQTVGAGRAFILRVFLMTGSFIGVLGTALGTIIGIAFTLNINTISQFIEKLSGANLFNAEIYFLSQLPSRIEASDIYLVTSMAIILSLLAALYPALRASSVNPAEELRHE